MDVPRRGAEHILETRTLPCGKCLGCRANQARDWAVRIMHERQMHEHGWFITLTYDNERIPLHGSLHPPDLQTFFKALRKRLPPKKLSYFACGEYGENTQRPHYHAVLFGPDFLDRIPGPTRNSHPTWRSQTLDRIWGHGLTDITHLTAGTASYIAGYVRKKISKRSHPNAYTRVDDHTGEIFDIQPEFTRMSRRPAIAKRWLEKFWTDVYPKDEVVLSGRPYRPPRFYDKWMAQHHPDILEDVLTKREQHAVFLDDAKLASKEAIHKARVSLYQKRNKI